MIRKYEAYVSNEVKDFLKNRGNVVFELVLSLSVVLSISI